MTRTIMETGPGHWLDFADPDPAEISLRDIAHALSNTCRFGGHVSRFYSVAEHACLVRRLVVRAGYPQLGPAALHHDSHEAYVCDLPTPMKNAIGPGYREMVAAIDAAIAEHLGIAAELFHHPAVVAADQLALRMEAAVLKDSRGIEGAWAWRELPTLPDDWEPGLAPEEARDAFLRAHNAKFAVPC